jgi:hypothetical protein
MVAEVWGIGTVGGQPPLAGKPFERLPKGRADRDQASDGESHPSANRLGVGPDLRVKDRGDNVANFAPPAGKVAVVPAGKAAVRRSGKVWRA